jgi:small nuclear ribonucleoprotein (snRNP)-like protein
MTIVLTAALVALAAGLALAVVVATRSSAALLAGRRRRRVLVTLKTEAAFAGVLYAVDREALVLRDAQALAFGPKKENVPVEGELVVLRPEVAYLQVLPSGAP